MSSSLAELGARYDSVCAELKKIGETSKHLRKTRNEIVEILQKYMMDNGLTEMKFGSFMVKVTKQKPKVKKLGKDQILDTLRSIFKQKDCEKIVKELFTGDNEEPEVGNKLTLKKLKS